MILRRRAMVPADIPECVEIIASHPVGGPRYGSWIEQLPQALHRLLESEAGASLVILASDSPRAPICWAGVSAIVRDDFLWELKRPPHFWVSAELTRRVVNGESPLLTRKELREANSRGGLNLVCWDGCARLGYESNGEGLYGDHLRRLLIALTRDPELTEVVRQVLQGKPCPTAESFYRLRTAGILIGEDAEDARLRCRLYATYLQRHL